MCNKIIISPNIIFYQERCKMICLNFVWEKLLHHYSDTAASRYLLSCVSNYFPSTVFIISIRLCFSSTITSISSLVSIRLIISKSVSSVTFHSFRRFARHLVLQPMCRICELPNVLNVSFHPSFFTVLFDVNNSI